MIEVIYRKESVENAKGRFKLPKNIKQIGGGETDIQVYMEDNVACYLQKVPDGMENIRYGVLLGQVRQSCGYNYIFIDAAVDVREIMNNTVIFSNDVWSGLNDEISYYFKDKQVVGWFLSEPYNNSSQSTWIKKTHINHFAGNDKIFFLFDREEDEENFYYYNNKMDKLPCYHIYYEKNEDMKSYVQLSGMNLRFKKKERYGDEGTLKTQPAQEARNVMIEEKGEQENKKEDKSKKNNAKYGMLMSRAASVLLVGALAYTAVTMGGNGTFDGVAENVKDYIGNIIDDTKQKGDETGIIPVSGTEIKSVSENNTDNKKSEEDGEKEDTQSFGKNDEENKNNNLDKKTENIDKDEQDDEKTSGEEETISTITPATTSFYTVKEGDTLYKICQSLYGNTDNMKVIMEMNQLEDADAIMEGENLIVP